VELPHTPLVTLLVVGTLLLVANAYVVMTGNTWLLPLFLQ
jgi:hypothetical protein